MGEVRDPGFSILPHKNPSFKDGVAYERKRIINIIKDHGSRNYLTEEQCLDLLDDIDNNVPKRFRDISNGE